MGNLGISIAIFFLYAKLFALGRYWVTVGSLFVPVFLLKTILVNRGTYKYIPQLAFLCIYPVIVYLLHIEFGTVYAVQASRFLLSFSLWVVSLCVIWCGFQPRTVLDDMNVSHLLQVLLILGIAQYVGLQYFHKTFAYDIIQPMSINDFYSSYVNITKMKQVRAVGSYYEPSMYGRVLVTLAMMQLVRKKSIFTFLGYTVIGFMISKSFVIMVFTVVAFALYVALQKRRISALLLFLILTITIAVPALEARLANGTESLAGNSTMIRTVLPLYVLSKVVPVYPYGVPIGSNETVVLQTTWQLATFTETKITNGLYEVVMYFGVFTLLLLAVAGWTAIRAIGKRDLSMALAILYLTFATAASGSYLGLESSLLIAIFTISMRRSSTSDELRVQKCRLITTVT